MIGPRKENKAEYKDKDGQKKAGGSSRTPNEWYGRNEGLSHGMSGGRPSQVGRANARPLRE